ncbi:DUF167 domain-containing protein [Reyranella sp.]|jgi:hypothetical protein|uniref:DUF167 domain-containing protein n=1 Tax=Reyranella sp. TaxID=1929291 RepID=UPI002F95A2CA
MGVRLANVGALNTPFLRRGRSGVTVELRVQPRARRTALEISGDVLKAAVTAPPENGKANAALVALLTESWRLPKSSFAVIKGATSRDKTVSVAGDPQMLVGRIEEWVKQHG